MSSDIDELRALANAIKGKLEGTASKKRHGFVERKIYDLKLETAQDQTGINLSHLIN